MPPTILNTKLFIPPSRPDQVTRTRLTHKLDDGLRPGSKLALILAPAGFGKTTLVTDWVGSLASRRPEIKVVWVSLDDRDNDIEVFLYYLVTAFHRKDAQIGEKSLLILENGGSPPMEDVLLPLVNDLAGSANPVLLVLDDYHVIQHRTIHDMLTFLIEHQPEQMQVVITTRQDPLLPLSRWRVRGGLTEIRMRDLRFSEDEAGEFLNGTMRLNLEGQDVAVLEARTEGWIAGLQLAAVSLQQTNPDPEAGSFSQFIKISPGTTAL